MLIQEGHLSVSDESICTSTDEQLRGLSLPSNSVNRLTDHAQHDLKGLTRPLNLNSDKQMMIPKCSFSYSNIF